MCMTEVSTDNDNKDERVKVAWKASPEESMRLIRGVWEEEERMQTFEVSCGQRKFTGRLRLVHCLHPRFHDEYPIVQFIFYIDRALCFCDEYENGVMQRVNKKNLIQLLYDSTNKKEPGQKAATMVLKNIDDQHPNTVDNPKLRFVYNKQYHFLISLRQCHLSFVAF